MINNLFLYFLIFINKRLDNKRLAIKKLVGSGNQELGNWELGIGGEWGCRVVCGKWLVGVSQRLVAIVSGRGRKRVAGGESK
jgi:hypothetical protein